MLTVSNPPDPPEPPTDEPEPESTPGPSLTTGEEITLVTGASVILEGPTPECEVNIFIDDVLVGDVGDDSDGDTFRFRVPTDGLEVGEHTAQLRCSDGTPVFERPFTLVRPVSNNSGGTGLIAFLMFLVLLFGGRFVLGGGLVDDQT